MLRKESKWNTQPFVAQESDEQVRRLIERIEAPVLVFTFHTRSVDTFAAMLSKEHIAEIDMTGKTLRVLSFGLCYTLRGDVHRIQ